MKKTIAMLLMAALLACCAFASADGPHGNTVKCEIDSDGGYVIRIAVSPGEGGEWVASDMAQDDSVVILDYARPEGGEFVVRYAPVGDGDMSVVVKHMDGVACDRVHTFDLRVQNGRVTESFGGSYAQSPSEEELDAFLSGEWLEYETQFDTMTVVKADRGWRVEVVSPMTHGAYVCRMTIFYDCELDEFVYADGGIWDVDGYTGEGTDLGTPAETDVYGCFRFVQTGEDTMGLEWYSSTALEDRDITFVRSDAFAG